MSQALTPFGYPEFLDAISALAAQLRRGPLPDRIVGIGRGGLTPAVYLSHAIGVPMLSLDWSAPLAGVSDRLLPSLADLSRAGERLLLVDDINDSGRTIAALRSALIAAGAAMERIGFAVLIDNIRSAARVDFAGRTIDRAIVKDWFVFPWEAVAEASDR